MSDEVKDGNVEAVGELNQKPEPVDTTFLKVNAEEEEAKRLAEAEAADAEEKERIAKEDAAYKEKLKELIQNVSANPGALEFPSDPWGFTSELKKIAILTASKVQGSDDKNRLLLAVLSIMHAHVRKRFEGDRQHFHDRMQIMAEAQEERAPRQRQTGLAIASSLMGE